MTSEQNRTDNPVASTNALQSIVNTEKWDIQSEAFHAQCRKQLEHDGVVVLPGFLSITTILMITPEIGKSSHQKGVSQPIKSLPNRHCTHCITQSVFVSFYVLF